MNSPRDDMKGIILNGRYEKLRVLSCFEIKKEVVLNNWNTSFFYLKLVNKVKHTIKRKVYGHCALVLKQKGMRKCWRDYCM